MKIHELATELNMDVNIVLEKAKKKRAIGRGLKMEVTQEQIDILFGELENYEK